MSTTLTPVPFTAPVVDGTRIALGRVVPAPHALRPRRPGPAFYPLISGRRMNHGLIAGAPGFGRHNVAAVLVASARAAMPLATVYLNGEADSWDKLSHPEIASTATMALLGRTVASTALAVLEHVADVRMRMLHALQAAQFRVAELPALLVVVDGTLSVFADDIRGWENLARRCGPLGIGILTIAETSRASEFGSRRLRDLLGGNIVALNPGGDAVLPEQRGLDESAPGRGRITDVDHNTAPFDAFHLGGLSSHVLSTYRDSPLDPRTHQALTGEVTS